MPRQFRLQEFCNKCSTKISHMFSKEQLLAIGGGLYSGVFLHKGNDGEIHVFLCYFDEDLNHRGTETSKLIIEKANGNRVKITDDSILLKIKSDASKKKKK